MALDDPRSHDPPADAPGPDQRQPVAGEVLVVTADEAARQAVAEAVAGVFRMQVLGSASEAAVFLDGGGARRVARLVIDASLGLASARALARAYFDEAPRGRVVLLGAWDDARFLLSLPTRDARWTVVFQPWNEAQLRTCLAGPALAATG